jgi:phosphoribosylformylglycinamidine synthase subunit PurSL
MEPVMISVPPTLLISSIGVVADVTLCQTMDFKSPGDPVYILGITRDECGGSEYYALMGERNGGAPFIGTTVPLVDAAVNATVYRALTRAIAGGMVASSLSIERGGLGIAIARSALAGMLGCSIDLGLLPTDGVTRADRILFSETQGRLLVTVDPAREAEFIALCAGLPCARIGTVTNDSRVTITASGGKAVASATLDILMESYRKTFRDF